MAEYYSKNLARKVNKGMTENVLKGLHTGGLPPLGYGLDPELIHSSYFTKYEYSPS